MLIPNFDLHYLHLNSNPFQSFARRRLKNNKHTLSSTLCISQQFGRLWNIINKENTTIQLSSNKLLILMYYQAFKNLMYIRHNNREKLSASWISNPINRANKYVLCSLSFIGCTLFVFILLALQLFVRKQLKDNKYVSSSMCLFHKNSE